MNYVELANERIANWERETEAMRLAHEARKLGLKAAPWSPIAHLDNFLIRASKGANERRARRETTTHNHKELAS